MKHLTLRPSLDLPPTRDSTNPEDSSPSAAKSIPASLPEAKEVKLHPRKEKEDVNASVYFVGTATTIIEWQGVRLMTDPNFLHAGDHVHLGPGVTGTRLTNPSVDLHALPRIDCILLSHYHADHFDQHVEASLRRDLPIITTPHARECLYDKKEEGERFENVVALDVWESALVDIKAGGGDAKVEETGKQRRPSMRVTGTPGKHVPSGGVIGAANELLGAVPPTNGWILELGSSLADDDNNDNDNEFTTSYRIYISGDTLLVSELHEIPQRYTHAGRPIDLMLVHLGGTTIPSPAMPLLMVTMDAAQGVELVRLVQPDVTIPIHYDDYDVFLSPLEDFKTAMREAGLEDKVVYLDRGDRYDFRVRD